AGAEPSGEAADGSFGEAAGAVDGEAVEGVAEGAVPETDGASGDVGGAAGAQRPIVDEAEQSGAPGGRLVGAEEAGLAVDDGIGARRHRGVDADDPER